LTVAFPKRGLERSNGGGTHTEHLMPLVAQALGGDRRAIAQLLSLVERGGDEARLAIGQLYPHTGCAHIVGITGAPGTGKSTLVCELAKAYRRQDQAVGIVAVDPTSPFSGGALLGDRIRMRELAGDAQVFIRSMASRGSLGGLARATADAVHVLDAAAYPVILVETVGAGQAEVDIARVAHTTLVLQMPASGDEIQAIKAGILEIADLIVVNKADLPGAENTAAALQAMLDFTLPHQEWHHGRTERLQGAGAGSSGSELSWRPPVIQTSALLGEGIVELLASVQAHWRYLEASGLRTQRERERASDELRHILRQDLLTRLLHHIEETDLKEAVEKIMARQEDPYAAARRLIVASGMVIEGV
jgi:LAO/AO transport system kinase